MPVTREIEQEHGGLFWVGSRLSFTEFERLLLRNLCRRIPLNPKFKNFPLNNQAISSKETLKNAT